MSQTSQTEFTLSKQVALYQQHLRKTFCDVVIKIEDEEFFVHGCIVAAASPKLYEVMEQNKTSVDIKDRPSIEVELKDTPFTAKTFEFILSYIYLGVIEWEKVTPELAKDIIASAEWCGLPQLAEDYMSINFVEDQSLEFSTNSAEDHVDSPTNSTIIMVDTFMENESSDLAGMENLTSYYSEAAKNQAPLYCLFCGKYFDAEDSEEMVEHMKTHKDVPSSESPSTSRQGVKRRRASCKVKQAYKSLIPKSKDDDQDYDYSNKRNKTIKKNARIPMFKKNYSCKYCKKKLPTEKSLNAHMKRQCQSNKQNDEPTSSKKLLVRALELKTADRAKSTKKNKTSIKKKKTSAGSSTKGEKTRKPKKKSPKPKVPKVPKPKKPKKKVDEWYCSHCPELVFKKKREQMTHLRVVHNAIKRYICEHCGKEMNGKAALALHTRIHTGERPFLCSICGRGFSEIKTMEAHLRVHTKERPFLCTLCGKDFAFRQSLYRHMKFHVGQRPYKCQICGKAFVLKQNLQDHIPRHEKHKLIDCPLCELHFANQKRLMEHRQEDHADGTQAGLEEDDAMETRRAITFIETPEEDIETMGTAAEYEVTVGEAILEHYNN